MKKYLATLILISFGATLIMLVSGVGVLIPFNVFGFILLFAFFLGINVIEGLERKKSKFLIPVLSFYMLGVIDCWLLAMQMNGVVFYSYNFYSPLDGVGVELSIVSTACFYMHKIIYILKEEFKKQNKLIGRIAIMMFLFLLCLFWFVASFVSIIETIYRVFC